MTDGVQVVVDYDVARWVMCPPPGLWDPQEWASRVADKWASDLARGGSDGWAEILAKMLVVADAPPRSPAAVARLVHVLTPEGEAPSVMPVDLSLFSADEAPGGLAQMIVRADDPDLIGPPIVEQVDLGEERRATRVVRAVNDSDGELRVELFLTWEALQDAELVFNTSSYETGRVLVMQDDLTALAAVTRLVPTTDAP